MSSRRYAYTKVLDQRKCPIRNLWARNGKFFARITSEDPQTGKKALRWVRLQMPDLATGQTRDVASVAEAKVELRKLLTRRDDNVLPDLRRKPKFCDLVEDYVAFHEKATGTQRASTLAIEKVHLGHWEEFFGETRLDQINLPRIRDFIAQKQASGWHARTVNLSVTVLRNTLRFAIEQRLLNRLPTEGLKLMKVIRPERRLVTLEEINRLCEKGLTYQNGQQFVDSVKLMAFAGARRNEALRLKWTAANWDRRQLTIGSDGFTKSGKSRTVDFSNRLEAHLKGMHSRRAPDSEWMFPSPRRGEVDRPAKTFVETLRLARASAELPRFGFHDLRHYFISTAVMAGIDYLTIARWVGHQDGGILIGKVYGHLSAEHAQRQARRMVFEPATMSKFPLFQANP